MKRIYVLSITVLLFITGWLPTINSSELSVGKTLYVGGSGAGNYSLIQSAIDNATTGDTVFVYKGTYYEHVLVDLSIDLIGEDIYTTILNGTGYGRVIRIWDSPSVSISGFTIHNASTHLIECKNSIGTSIIGNILQNKNGGVIQLLNCQDMIISNNIIEGSWSGIGIEVRGSSDNSILENTIKGNSLGCILLGANRNIIMHNNFLDNQKQVFFRNVIPDLNLWLDNYWDNWIPFMPKPIFGTIENHYGSILVRIPRIKFDLNPAREPFDNIV